MCLSRVGAPRSGSIRDGPVPLLCSVPPVWLAGRNPVVGATWVRLRMRYAHPLIVPFTPAA